MRRVAVASDVAARREGSSDTLSSTLWAAAPGTATGGAWGVATHGMLMRDACSGSEYVDDPAAAGAFEALVAEAMRRHGDGSE